MAQLLLEKKTKTRQEKESEYYFKEIYYILLPDFEINVWDKKRMNHLIRTEKRDVYITGGTTGQNRTLDIDEAKEFETMTAAISYAKKAIRYWQKEKWQVIKITLSNDNRHRKWSKYTTVSERDKKPKRIIAKFLTKVKA